MSTEDLIGKTKDDYDVNRIDRVYDRYRSADYEERPKRECPHCGRHDLYKEFVVKLPTVIEKLLPFLDPPPEDELGLQPFRETCDNCGYKEQ